jgi:hypothetical protein
VGGVSLFCLQGQLADEGLAPGPMILHLPRRSRRRRRTPRLLLLLAALV